MQITMATRPTWVAVTEACLLNMYRISPRPAPPYTSDQPDPAFFFFHIPFTPFENSV